MSIDLSLPLSLYKANLALSLRTLELLLEGRQQWLEQGTHDVSEDIEETRAEVDELIESQDWQALAALPGHAAWRLLDRQVGDLQAATQTAVAVQTTFASGWQQALASWQQASARALSEAGNAMPLHTSLRDLLQNWGSLPAVEENGDATATPKKTARTAPAAKRKGATRVAAHG